MRFTGNQRGPDRGAEEPAQGQRTHEHAGGGNAPRPGPELFLGRYPSPDGASKLGISTPGR